MLLLTTGGKVEFHTDTGALIVTAETLECSEFTFVVCGKTGFAITERVDDPGWAWTRCGAA